MERSPRCLQCSDIYVQRLHCPPVSWNVRERPLLCVFQAVFTDPWWSLREIDLWFEELGSPLRHLLNSPFQLVTMSMIYFKIQNTGYSSPPLYPCSWTGTDIDIQLASLPRVTVQGWAVGWALEEL